MRTSAVNSKYIFSKGKRFEGKFYLNDNSFLSMEVERHAEKTKPLSELATVFNPPVFKRQFCQQTERSVPYFQSSDVPVAEERSQTFVYKGQAEALNLLVKKGDILVTGFGTIGNTRLVSKYQNGTCYANNVCRIRTNDGIYRGYVYAFLSSKFGVSQLNNNASGSVVRYIEAPGIKKTLVPNFPESFQKEVDDLIQESVRLREEATEALEEAKHRIEELFPNIQTENIGIVRSSEIFTSLGKRFEALFHQSAGKEYDSYIKENFQWESLSTMATVSRPDLFKRNYVKNGLMFFGGRDIFLSTPKSEKFVSKTKTPDISSLVISEGTILMPRSGTIGEVAIATSQHAQKLASEHVIRISADNILRAGYLYAFLSSSIGKALIQRYIFGSVIQHVEPHQLNHIPIPVLEEEEMKVISDLAISNKDKLGQAGELENMAIKMVEDEIEKWNH